MYRVTETKHFDEIIAKLSPIPDAEHLVVLFRAVRDGVIALAQAPRGTAVPIKQLDKANRPAIALIGDDDYQSSGPSGWKSMHRLLGWAKGALIHGTGADVPSYAIAIQMALHYRRFLLVETDSAHVREWGDLLRSRDVPFLALCPSNARASGGAGAGRNPMSAVDMQLTESLTPAEAAHDAIAGIEHHPVADLFPLMDGRGYAALVEDVRARGLRSPIIMLDGMILDGRNRYRACIDAGVPIQTENFTGNDPLGYVISANLHRRHLNEGQRAMAAAKLANMRQGERTDLAQICAKSQDQAAELLNISRRSVQHAAIVRDYAVPDLVEKAERGELAISLAAEAAKLPPDEQREIAGLPEAKIRSTVRSRAKQAKRSQREKQLAQATIEASARLGEKRYGVIYCDPPWRFEPYSRETGMDRAADNHYPTMSTDEIARLQIPAADDCALFLWTTVPMQRHAHEIMAAWGFEYRSQMVWVKSKTGTGYWARNKHELLLIGIKGHVPAPAPGEQFESVIVAPVGAHSEKPSRFAEIIETMFPTLPRVEMFARTSRPGWDVWGNEVIGGRPGTEPGGAP